MAPPRAPSSAPARDHRAAADDDDNDRLIPAHLAFLAIYNPALGPTDETFPQQVVYWWSATRGAKGRDANEEENEKLRRVGLAQGMVGFAKTFSHGQSVDSVETERSRVVISELENGWWILASINLTRLPAGGQMEYSSREVSPAALLTQQLAQAHGVFLLHHGPTLDELFVKLSRDKFCRTLERYWTRFARTWDVLLHGNPAVEVLGGIKLAAGGEIGVGVGEEEWGSGEREVLEDLTRRTEGLVDLVVARYGDPAPKRALDEGTEKDPDALPWLGAGNVPGSADGIVFSGLGAIKRSSLRSVSLWMQHIYTYGDHAYGVRDNPHRERRRRRRRNPPTRNDTSPNATSNSQQPESKDLRQKVQRQEAIRSDSSDIDPAMLPKDDRPQIHDRVASHDHATHESMPQIAGHPGVPPPIVSAAENALQNATKSADNESHKRGTEEAEDNTTLGIPDQYMKYMTFGLSSFAKTYTRKRTDAPQSTGTTMNGRPPGANQLVNRGARGKASRDADANSTLNNVEPKPDGQDIRIKIAKQVHLENKGSFVVGLTGDLDSVAGEDDSVPEDSAADECGGSRTLLRTLQVEMTPKEHTYAEQVDDDLQRRDFQTEDAPENPAVKNFRRLRVAIYIQRPFMYCFLFEQRTASLSYGSLYQSLRNNIAPIHKALLASTSAATVAQRVEASHLASNEIEDSNTRSRAPSPRHNALPPKPTDTTPIFDLLFDPARLTLHTSIPNIPIPGTSAAEGLDIITNTNRSRASTWSRLDALNVHTQILTILAATSQPRAESELERTCKTSRGWWVVWLRLPGSIATDDERPHGNHAFVEGWENGKPAEVGAASASKRVSSSARPSTGKMDSMGGPISTLGVPSSMGARTVKQDLRRVALLVRKSEGLAAGATAGAGAASGSRSASGMWSSFGLRGSSGQGNADDTGGNGLTGFGIDARQYVEGLLSLNR